MQITDSWSAASISAIAAVGGSLVGALGSNISAWIAQRYISRQNLLAKTLAHREQLYSDFITETARALTDAMQHTFQDPSMLIPSYALLSRIRLSSSKQVVESAERVINNILDTYSQPNLTPEQFKAWAVGRNDPLREFGEVCRRDLESQANRL
jgi:hypothetical protein